jgi:hypothetical protein
VKLSNLSLLFKFYLEKMHRNCLKARNDGWIVGYLRTSYQLRILLSVELYEINIMLGKREIIGEKCVVESFKALFQH